MPNLVAYDLSWCTTNERAPNRTYLRNEIQIPLIRVETEALFNEAPDTAFSAQHPDGGNDVSAGYTQNEGALTGGAVGFGTTGGTQQN